MKKKKSSSLSNKQKIKTEKSSATHQKLPTAQKKSLERNNDHLVGANSRQECVNGIQDSYSNPLMINTGHPSNETYLGGAGPSVESPPLGATGDHLSYEMGFDPEMLQWFGLDGHPDVDENGNRLQNVTETVIVNQNNTRQNDASMHDFRADQPDYPPPENPLPDSIQPEDQTGHGDANGYDI